MMAKITSLTFIWILISNVAICQTSTISYQQTKAVIANPERGWYDDYYSHNSGKTMGVNYDSLDVNTLISNREKDKITLIHRNFYLHEFFDQNNVSSEYLGSMQFDFDAIRAAGVKCIIRFAYSASEDAEIWDATPEKVFSHIASLSDILKKNADVIAGMQAGFVGVWGEWYYTKNFARSGYQPDETDQENRRILVEKLLEILPEQIGVQTRTPAIMRNIVETDEPISESEAFDGSIKSRVGHHNDCYLANSSDYGTYENVAVDIPYLNQSTKYTITGGETCDATNKYSDCDNGLQRMKDLHWTYLNRDYNKSVYTKWKNQACYNEIDIALGYRIALVKATLGDSVNAGSELALKFEFENSGYAAPMFYKPIQIVLTNTETKQNIVRPYQGSNDDIRYWLPGTINCEGKVIIPDTLVSSNYTIGIKFPDQDANLSKNIAYSIQLANPGLWNTETGINNLSHIVSVGTGGVGELPKVPDSFNATAVSETGITLLWLGNSDAILGYEIMRSRMDDDNWLMIAELTADELAYTDNDLDSGTRYNYIIRSKNEYGYSNWSQSASSTTLGISDIQEMDKPMQIYPNPLGNSDLVMQFIGATEKQIVIATLTGQIIFDYKTNLMEVKINRSLFQQGVYVLNILQPKGIESSKLIVY